MNNSIIFLLKEKLKLIENLEYGFLYEFSTNGVMVYNIS